MGSAIVLGQEHPIEVTWQKTQTSAQDPVPVHESHQAAIVLPLEPTIAYG